MNKTILDFASDQFSQPQNSSSLSTSSFSSEPPPISQKADRKIDKMRAKYFL